MILLLDPIERMLLDAKDKFFYNFCAWCNDSHWHLL